MAFSVNLNTLQKLQLQGSPYGTTDFWQVATLNLDNSYPSKGYAITPSQFNMNSILGMVQIGYAGTATPSVFYYDSANASLRVFETTSSFTSNNITATMSTLAEVPVGSAVLNNVSPTFLVIGF